MNLLNTYLSIDKYTISAETTKNVEVVSFKTDGGFLISVIDLMCSEELIPINPFKIRIKSDREVNIIKLPEKTPIPSNHTDGFIEFLVDEFTMFDMYSITEI